MKSTLIVFELLNDYNPGRFLPNQNESVPNEQHMMKSHTLSIQLGIFFPHYQVIACDVILYCTAQG